MTGRNRTFSRLARSTIDNSGASSLLQRGQRAFVLERIARAAGATRWYVLRDPVYLAAMTARVSPGSSLSFYFDDRITARHFDPRLIDEALAIIPADGDVFYGRHNPRDIEVRPFFVAGSDELFEFEQSLQDGEEVYFGRFPAPDNDGRNAITVTLPDVDGVVRSHPH
jgi:hypothetical protein